MRTQIVLVLAIAALALAGCAYPSNFTNDLVHMGDPTYDNCRRDADVYSYYGDRCAKEAEQARLEAEQAAERQKKQGEAWQQAQTEPPSQPDQTDTTVQNSPVSISSSAGAASPAQLPLQRDAQNGQALEREAALQTVATPTHDGCTTTIPDGITYDEFKGAYAQCLTKMFGALDDNTKNGIAGILREASDYATSCNTIVQGRDGTKNVGLVEAEAAAIRTECDPYSDPAPQMLDAEKIYFSRGAYNYLSMMLDLYNHYLSSANAYADMLDNTFQDDFNDPRTIPLLEDTRKSLSNQKGYVDELADLGMTAIIGAKQTHLPATSSGSPKN